MVDLTPHGGSSGDLIVYGTRTGNHNALPAEALGPMIDKNISVAEGRKTSGKLVLVSLGY